MSNRLYIWGDEYDLENTHDVNRLCDKIDESNKDGLVVIAYALLDFEEAKSFKPTLIFPNPNNTL